MSGAPWKKDAGKLDLEYQRERVDVPLEETLEEISRHPGAARVMFAPVKVRAKK